MPGQDIDEPEKFDGNKVKIDGKLVLRDKEEFSFQSVYVTSITKSGDGDRYIALNFVTREKDGISYIFKGIYAEVETQEREGEPYIKIRGTFCQERGSKTVFCIDLELYEYGEM